jgi:hypothetical protein
MQRPVEQGAVRLKNSLCLQTIPAEKDVDHSAVANAMAITELVQLPIKGHGASARALRHRLALNPLRLATNSMTMANWLTRQLEANGSDCLGAFGFGINGTGGICIATA